MVLQKVDRVLTNLAFSQDFSKQVNHNNPNALDIIEAGGEICGPHWVIPGWLSVSWAIGDAHAKLKRLNGNPNVIISEPEIKHFKICASHDFIILGSDGLYDKLNNS